MASETRCLETYIKRIHYGDDFTWRERIFDYGITHRPPFLKSGRINRILVYPGSFNPPHRGHFELLRHGFGEAGRDMNTIAATVLPLDDESLVKKLRGQENALIFTKAERIRLWKGYGSSDWCWIFDGSVSEWCGFQKRLTQAITKDGFDISWVVLCGPDYVKVNEVPSMPVWGCKDIIVSDVGRPADFISPAVNRLKALEGCKAWEKAVLDLKALQRYAKEVTSWVYSGTFMIAPICARRMLDEGGFNSAHSTRQAKVTWFQILIALSEWWMKYSTRLLNKVKPSGYAAGVTTRNAQYDSYQ